MLTEVTALGAQLMRDLRQTSPIVPEIDYDQTPFRDDEEGFTLRADHEGERGIVLNHVGSPVEQVEMAISQAQDWIIDLLQHSGRPPIWPECRLHPGTHPLKVTDAAGTAVWSCPKTGDVIAPVGSL